MAKGVARDRKVARGSIAAGRSIGPVLRLFGVAAIGCIAAGAAVLMYPRAEEAPAAPVRAESVKSTASLAKAPEPVRAAAATPAQPASRPSAPTTQTPAPQPATAATPAQTASVPAPPLPAPAPPVPLPAAATAYVPLPSPAPARSAEPAPAAKPEQGNPVKFAGASVDCLSPDLIAVLREVQAKFGPVTVVSGKELHTRNHSAGSARHKLHSECKAVDFTVSGDADAVIAFLKARPEVNGVNSYRPNHLIHIDLNDRRRLATR